jgi:hypothetical protein
MEWILLYYWAAALSASETPMTWWGFGPPPRHPATNRDNPRAADLDLIKVLYEVIVEQVDCAICGARLERAVKVELIRRSLPADQILVTTHCRGRKRHHHEASVVEQAGDLRFGVLRQTRHWQTRGGVAGVPGRGGRSQTDHR